MWRAWHAAGLDKGTPREVECIKELVGRALPWVQQAWKSILTPMGIKVQLRGIVCHGHPWVSYPGAAQRCELGDFLLVHDHLPPSGGPIERRGVIVQAKIFHPDGVRAKNSTQLDLYQTWPRFTYESWPGGIAVLDALLVAKGLSGKLPQTRQRELKIAGSGRPAATPAMLDDGCRYGMIDIEHSRWGDPKGGMNPWRLCSANSAGLYTSQAGFTLGSYLVRLMAGEVGRQAPDIAWPKTLAIACQWSLMINELMSLLPYMSPGSTGQIAFLAATHLHAGIASRIPGATILDKDDEGGFGIIHVRTTGDLDRASISEGFRID